MDKCPEEQVRCLDEYLKGLKDLPWISGDKLQSDADQSTCDRCSCHLSLQCHRVRRNMPITDSCNLHDFATHCEIKEFKQFIFLKKRRMTGKQPSTGRGVAIQMLCKRCRCFKRKEQKHRSCAGHASDSTASVIQASRAGLRHIA